jgi:DNA-binding response OmpR family regulator
MKTVLCIEDDRFIGEMYVRSLERAGFVVDWLVDGDDALVAAQNKKYDFILVDLMLPNKKGDELISVLRGQKEDLVPEAKIVVITNYQQTAEDRLAIEKLVDAYFIKADLTPRKLVQILEEME